MRHAYFRRVDAADERNAYARSLGSSAASGNDSLKVNGNLTVSNTILINLLQDQLADGTYTLITYSGALSGSFNPTVALSTGGSTRYTLTISTSTPGQVNLLVSGSEANLKWSSTSSSAWDIASSVNWVNLGSSAPDKFFQGDTVLLDDSTPGVVTGLTLATNVAPSSINNTANTNNYSITGTAKITGPRGINKQGTNTLMIGTSTDFTGTVLVQARRPADNEQRFAGFHKRAYYHLQRCHSRFDGNPDGQRPEHRSGTRHRFRFRRRWQWRHH